MTRRGWTLHEMLISLGVMAVAAGLAAHAAVVQLRFFRGAGEIVALRGQVAAVGAIVAATVWGVSPQRGDITFAADSALEVRAALGTAVACDGVAGRITIPVPEATGNALSGFDSMPDAGDVVDAFVEDSSGAGWVRGTVASAGAAGSQCQAFPQSAGTLSFALREPLLLPAGAALRFSRPVRLSHYRASDGQWYFGVRDWNSGSQRLNTVQPVAGPLEPHSGDVGKSGLVFRYFDVAGAELASPADPSRVATIAVLARGRSRRPVTMAGRFQQGVAMLDSSLTTVSLRNAR